jgi:hypothetical protein
LAHAFDRTTPPLCSTSITEASTLTGCRWVDLIRKVDKASGKLTIKHGPINNLDMPGMTMVFQVRNIRSGEHVLRTSPMMFDALSELIWQRPYSNRAEWTLGSSGCAAIMPIAAISLAPFSWCWKDGFQKFCGKCC